MIFNEFINKTNKYLKSVRMLKTHISFDMTFPHTWIILKSKIDGIEIIENQSKDNIKIISFVLFNESKLIDSLEKLLDTIIMTNIEREEKNILFKSKVDELKNIFEKENLDNLKGLKFDIYDLPEIIKNEK